MEESKDVQYYPSANWAYLQGNFTPDQLRAVAKEIEEAYKIFQAGQEKRAQRKEG